MSSPQWSVGARRWLTAASAGLAMLGAMAGCGGGSSTAPPSASESAEQAAINGAPVADPAAIPAGSWADQIRKRGVLKVGGTDAGPLFSLKDPATGRLSGFDAGLSQMLARYILGQPRTTLTLTTVDTRETLIQNGTVDAVFATYTITEPRAEKIGFAGPYYQSGDAIMVRKDDSAIRTVADLNGRTVATQGNSTAAVALKKFAPNAKPLLFQGDDECVAAVTQGRADAYVLDQGILIADASTNPRVKVVGEPFTQEPYGIGVTRDDPAAKQFVNTWLQKILDDGSWAKLWKATIGTVVSGDPPPPPKIGSVPGS
jgi:glutamate transport system substrate-binding protein